MNNKNKIRANTKNTHNPYSNLYKKLTRLFSGPIVNYRRETEKNLRYKDVVKYGDKLNSLSGQQFKRLEHNPFHNLNLNTMAAHNRGQRYNDFQLMEHNPDLSSALDIFADEMTTSSDLQPLLKIICPNEEIREILSILYKSVLNIEFNLFSWCRTMCKYGDYFLYLDTDEKQGVVNVINIPTIEMERVEGQDPTNPNYVQFQWNVGGMTFENWQIAHFRILGDDRYLPYGMSVLDPARRIWRQLDMLENAMMSYRIVRSPERRVFYVDVGTIAPQDVEQYMQKFITQMKRNQVVDPNTGQADLRYNPMSTDEDFYIPIRGAAGGTRIDSLPGGTYTGDIDDVKYLRDKLFSAIKIPMSYLSRGEGASEDNTSLTQKDIRFARTIQRLQRSVISELEKIGIVHLYMLGYRGEDLLSFKLHLNNPSKIAELQELEHWKTKFQVASEATEGFFSRRWIAKRLFNLSDEEYLRNQREMFSDRVLDSELDGIAGGGEADSSGGGIGSELDSLGGDEVPAEDLSGQTPPEEEVLMAAPAKRDDEAHLTAGAKGKWYTPEINDKRDQGARNKSYKSKFSDEKASNSRRNIFTGMSKIDTLSKGIYENDESIYIREENDILKTNNDIKKLICELDNKFDNKKE